MKSSNLYAEAQERLKDLRQVQKRLLKEATKYPEGRIRILKSKNRIQYYLRMDSMDKSGAYIPKKDTYRIKLYLQKKYNMDSLRIITEEIKHLEKFLKNTMTDKCSKAEAIRQLLDDYPEDAKRYIQPVDVSDQEFIKEWQSEAFEGKEVSETTAVFITEKGERVRSKSELAIANMLYKYGIPYKYECPIVLKNGVTVHPDFTIFDVRNRKELYWEHLGRMGDPDYVVTNIKKLKDYNRSGVVFGDNLIITMETASMPLGTDEILAVIRAILER